MKEVTMKTIEIKGETFIVKENRDLRESCYGCYFHKGTRWNKREPGNCQGSAKILEICADNNLGHNYNNVIMIKKPNGNN